MIGKVITKHHQKRLSLDDEERSDSIFHFCALFFHRPGLQEFICHPGHRGSFSRFAVALVKISKQMVILAEKKLVG